MCGIAGVIAKRELRAADLLQQMIPSLQHRGPDDTGIHMDQGAAFANVRLAIVDRSSGAQPMYTAEQRVGIVYNGEVYDYRELRAQLEARGARFNNHSDTEVVLKAYEHWGVDSFAQLNGMFGVCIWDKREDAVYLVRDHLGIKPLYIYEDDNFYAFASELKALLALPGLDLSISPEGVADYLTYRYLQAPYTLFKKIRRLPAGSYLRITDTGCVLIRFWEPESKGEDLSIKTIDEAAAQFDGFFRRAVDSQLMGEVPIGVMLSGGLDSSAIVNAVHEVGADLRTYNIGFPEVNEFEYSRAVAKSLGLQHFEVVTTPEQLAQDADLVMMALDEPLCDVACLPLYELCKTMKQDVTVCLSGEGGDELFAGYPQYIPVDVHRHVPPVERFRQFLIDSSYTPDNNQFFKQPVVGQTIYRNRTYFLEQAPLQGMLNFDIRTWLPDNLMMKADKILMAHSLEGRFPFLDKDLVEFSLRLPAQFKRLEGDEIGKRVIRHSMAQKLPVEVLRRRKMGFTVPIGGILRVMRDEVLDTFRAAERSPLSEVLNMTLIRMEAERFYRDKTMSPLRMWTLYVLCRWMTLALPNYRRGNVQEACPGRSAPRMYADRAKQSGGGYGKSVHAG